VKYLYLSTTSITTTGIKDREELTEQLLNERGIKDVKIVREMVYVTYNPTEVSMMLIYNLVKRNCTFVSGG
jgi:hypothetical protein